MFVAIREVSVFLCEALGVKDRLRETAEELLLAFKDRLELTLGCFLVELTGLLFLALLL